MQQMMVMKWRSNQTGGSLTMRILPVTLWVWCWMMVHMTNIRFLSGCRGRGKNKSAGRHVSTTFRTSNSKRFLLWLHYTSKFKNICERTWRNEHISLNSMPICKSEQESNCTHSIWVHDSSCRPELKSEVPNSASNIPTWEFDPMVEVPSMIPCQQSSTVLLDPVTSEKEMTCRSNAEHGGTRDGESQFLVNRDSEEIQADNWEEELEETVCGPVSQVKGWDDLWIQNTDQDRSGRKKKKQDLVPFAPQPTLHSFQLCNSSSQRGLMDQSQPRNCMTWHEHEGVHMARCIHASAQDCQTF